MDMQTLLPIADAVVKATILLAITGLVSALMRRASAAARHLVWTAGLASVLVLPALSVAVPRWQVAVVTLPSQVAQRIDTSAAPLAAAPVSSVDDAAASHVAPPLRRTGTVDASAPAQPSPSSRSLPSWPVLLAIVWAAGAAVVLGRLAIGLLAVALMSRHTARVIDAAWLPLARELASDLGIRRRVEYLRSGNATMPMAWGLFRPAVMMPASADAWPVERLRVVLLHELAHVKRRDCLTHALAQVACAIYWFNPLAWVAARRLRTEREHACDDLVLAAGTRGSDYANQLLEIARVMNAGRFPAVLAGATLAMAHRSQLEGRLMAILDTTMPRSGAGRIRTCAITTLFALALVPLASMQPWAYASHPDATTNHTSEQPPAEMSVRDQAPRVEQAAAPGLEGVRGGVAGAVSQAVTPGVAAGVTAGVTASAAGVTESVTKTVEATAQSPTPTPTPTPMPMPTPMPTPTPMPNTNWDGNWQREPAQRKAADPKVVAALSAALKDTDKGVREQAMHALIQLRDPNIFEPLVQALTDSSAEVRQQAAHGLSQLRDKRAVTPLLAALKDQNASVREQVVFALGQLRDPASVPDLLTALRDSGDSVREQAAFALGQIRDKRAIEGLISALKDKSPSVREQSAFALGQLRASTAVEALVVALQDESASVREQAAFALGQIRDPRAIDGLTAALKDKSASVRQQAAFALGQVAR